MTEVLIDSSKHSTNQTSVKTGHVEQGQVNTDSTTNLGDNAGDLDFSALAKGVLARREIEKASFSIPSKADLFIPPNAIDYPLDFEEPPPYFLNAEEWNIYIDRRKKIESRREETLRGTF